MSEEDDTLYELDMAQLSINAAREKMKEIGDTEALDTVAIAQTHIDQAREAVTSGGDIDAAVEHVDQAISILSTLLKP